MLIDDEAGARRLARAIMADITLYNSERLAHALDPERDLASELAEGRQLFQSRVAPAHHAIFEDAVRAWAMDARARATSAAIAPKKEEPAPPPREDRARDEELRREEAVAAIKRQRVIMLAVTVLITCALAYLFLTSSHHRQPAQETQDKHEGH